MDALVQTLAFILPIIAAVCVLCVFCISIYFKIRRRIPITVNCWFCNEWTKVQYNNYNSFTCPNCLQYNGFDQGGGYNRVLPEQHDELLNKQVPLIQKNSGLKSSNGLCHICNNNQKLKIYQLANFVPLNEDTYDVEVEHFQKQLEKAYKLCSRCEGVVKKVVTVQNKWLLGIKMKIMKMKGLSFPDHNLSNSPSKKSTSNICVYFQNFILILFASITFVLACSNMNLLPEYINKETLDYATSYTYPVFEVVNNTRIPRILHEYIDSNNIIFNEYINTSALIFKNVIPCNVSSLGFINNIDITTLKSFYLDRPNISLCLAGFLLLITSTFLTKNGAWKSIKLLFLWCALLYLTWSRYSDEFPLIIHTLQAITGAYIIYSFFNNNHKRKEKRKVLTTKRNNITVNNKQPYQEDLSDQEEDMLSDIPCDIFNSTLKPKQSYEIDTAESDCSFETVRSKYTSIQNLFKEPLPRISSPLAAYKIDHVFGKPASFQCQLAVSPVPFRESRNQNVVHNEPFMCSNTIRSCSPSFKDLNHSFCESVRGKSNIFNDTAFRGLDLDQRLNNLHLGKKRFNMNTSKTVHINILKSHTCRPILSPPKFLRANYNSWLPGDGIWKRFKDTNYEAANFSSSSSQSSGFASQNNDCPELKSFSQYYPRHGIFGVDYNAPASEVSHQEKFTTYRNHNANNHHDVFREQIKVNPRLNHADHFFKPIKQNVISNEKLFNDRSYSANTGRQNTSHTSSYS